MKKLFFYLDFNCPYSYIAYLRLKKAIEKTDINDWIIFELFESEPAVGAGNNTPTKLRLMEKYGLSESEARDK